MKTIEMTRTYTASPEAVFACLNDLGVTGMHMRRSSAPMMGGKLDLLLLSPHHTGPGTRYRWKGKVLWMDQDFTVEVTRWEQGKEKIWQTTGAAKMIVYSFFLMYLKVQLAGEGTTAILGISYERPESFLGRILCFLLGAWYARWCLNMLRAAAVKLADKHQGAPEGA